MQAVVDGDVADTVDHAQAVQVTPASDDKVVESDVLVIELRDVGVQVKQVIFRIDPTADIRVTKTSEVFIEKINVFVHVLGVDDEGEVLVGGYGLCRFYITGIVFVEKGLKGCGQVMDGELTDDGAVEFVTQDGDGFFSFENAGLEGEGVK